MSSPFYLFFSGGSHFMSIALWVSWLVKYGGDALVTELTRLFQQLSADKGVPEGFTNASLKNLYKNKGNRRVCDNHRGISLLNVAGKVFARVILNHFMPHINSMSPKASAGSELEEEPLI